MDQQEIQKHENEQEQNKWEHEPIEENRRAGTDGGFNILGLNFGQLFIVLIIAAFASYLVSNMFFANKSAYQADVTRLEKDMVAMRDVEKGIAPAQASATDALNKIVAMSGTLQQYVPSGTLTSQINALKSELQGNINTAMVNSSNAVTTVNGIKSSVDDLNKKLTELSAKEAADAARIPPATDISGLQKSISDQQKMLDDLKGKYDSLNAKLANFGTTTNSGGTTTTTGYNGIRVEINTLGSMPMTLPSLTAATESSVMFMAKLTNLTSFTLTNIQMSAMIQSNVPIAVLMATGYPQLMDGINTWTLLQSTQSVSYFANNNAWLNSGFIGSTLTLNPGQSRTLYMQYKLEPSTANFSTTMYFYPQINIDSYTSQ